jgi:hypothetical protein
MVLFRKRNDEAVADILRTREMSTRLLEPCDVRYHNFWEEE